MLVGLTPEMTMPVAGPVCVWAPPGRVPSPRPRSLWPALTGQPAGLATPSLPAQSTGVCVHSPDAAPGCSAISAPFTAPSVRPLGRSYPAPQSAAFRRAVADRLQAARPSALEDLRAG